MIAGTCDCGGVRITLPALPDSINACSCGWCRRNGAAWAYFPKDSVAVTGQTATYERAARAVRFHRCATCGVLTHWLPTGRFEMAHMGVNVSWFDPAPFADVPVIDDPPDA